MFEQRYIVGAGGTEKIYSKSNNECSGVPSWETIYGEELQYKEKLQYEEKLLKCSALPRIIYIHEISLPHDR